MVMDTAVEVVEAEVAAVAVEEAVGVDMVM